MGLRNLNNCRQSEQDDGGESDQPKPQNRKGAEEDMVGGNYNNVPTNSISDEVKSKAPVLKRYSNQLSVLLNSQYRVKKVRASKHVLDTYHDSFLYGKVPPSVKVRAALRAGWIGNIWHFVSTFYHQFCYT